MLEWLNLDAWIQNLNDVVITKAFWVALGLVILFAYSRFRVTDEEDEKPSLPLHPRSFTTAFRFWLAMAVYIGSYAALYLLILLASTFPALRSVLFEATNLPELPTQTPAWAALVATALIPSIILFSWIDHWLRHKLQAFASIPIKAQLLAKEVLAALREPEPEIDSSSPSRRVVDAIKAHRKRFEQLKQVWTELKNTRARPRRRYTSFEKYNRYIIDGVSKEMSAAPRSEKNIDKSSACFIEEKYRLSVNNLAELMMCSMLLAENTEYRIRQKLINQNISVKKEGGLNFGSNTLTGSAALIAFSVFIFSIISIIMYYVFRGFPIGASTEDISLMQALRDNVLIFVKWSAVTVAIYLPPIAVAAGAAMYFRDRQILGGGITVNEYVTAATLTFASTALLCFFILLGYGILVPSILKRSEILANILEPNVLNIREIAPWAVPPAALATVFMLLSVVQRERRSTETLWYVLWLGGVASITSVIIASLTGLPPKSEMGSLPLRSFYFLAAITPIGLGGALGWILSGTRYPRVRGTASDAHQGVQQQVAT